MIEMMSFCVSDERSMRCVCEDGGDIGVDLSGWRRSSSEVMVSGGGSGC
jgi:hypothetical protein